MNDSNFWTRRVFFRCVLFLSAFLICYGPPFMTFVYKAITKNEMPLWVDFASCIFSILDPLLVPLLIASGPDYKPAIVRFFNKS
jgi:hypothetical protein